MDVRTPRATPPTVRVAVASDLRLVAEAVGAALTDAGLDVIRTFWIRPGAPETAGSAALVPPDVMVMVWDTAGDPAVAVARALVAAYEHAPLVVADGRPGPWWGALYEAGAAVVLPPTVAIADLAEAIRALTLGEQVTSVVERQSYLRQWFAARADRQVLRDRLATLTPREHEVLQHLHRGESAAVVAQRLGVSQATVRSQIRGLMGKLDVRSQLAAVAALEAVLSEERPDLFSDP